MAASYAMVVWRLDAAETVALTLAFGLIVGLVNAALDRRGRRARSSGDAG